LENETQELRRRLEQRSSWSGPSIATPPTTIEPNIHRVTPVQNGVPMAPTRIQAIVSPPATDTNEDHPPPTPLLTQSQTLQGVTLLSSVVDELFKV
jgi:hypothetical protein